MNLAVDDRVRVIDQTGAVAPLSASVIQVSRFYVFVWYDPADRRRLHYPDKADMYYLDSGWRAWDGETRWRLQLIRTCAWCGHDVSGPGEAHPVMYARNGPASGNWNCADRGACTKRQDELDAQAGMPPIAEIWRVPVAMLEAAS